MDDISWLVGISALTLLVVLYCCLVTEQPSHWVCKPDNGTWCLSQARINWEGCGRNGIKHKMMGMMEVEASISLDGWH